MMPIENPMVISSVIRRRQSSDKYNCRLALVVADKVDPRIEQAVLEFAKPALRRSGQ